MRLDETTRERYRTALLAKGQQVANLLAEVLAGADKELEIQQLPIFGGKPGMRPEEKLRAFLGLIESRRELLVNGDDRFGRCDVCGRELSELELDEMPWADRCRECAGR